MHFESQFDWLVLLHIYFMFMARKLQGQRTRHHWFLLCMLESDEIAFLWDCRLTQFNMRAHVIFSKSSGSNRLFLLLSFIAQLSSCSGMYSSSSHQNQTKKKDWNSYWISGNQVQYTNHFPIYESAQFFKNTRKVWTFREDFVWLYESSRYGLAIMWAWRRLLKAI